MKVLYLDNFRGFSNTTVPLRSVNFLVGENSTGKSSLLALIRLLCSPDFWIGQSFNSREYEFGGFRDTLSAMAQDKSHFLIGYLQRNPKGKGEINECYLLAFVERNALPSISSMVRMQGQNLMAIRFQGKGWYHRLTQISEEWDKAEELRIFDTLRRESERDISEFTKAPKNFPATATMLTFFNLLSSCKRGENLNTDSITFPFSYPPMLHRNLVWLAPIRTRPKRTYDGYGRPFSPEGEHTPYLLRKWLSTKKHEEFTRAIETFGKESGLFRKVVIKRHGKGAAAPFELLMEFDEKKLLSVNSVGYGVSQVLPLVVEIIVRGNSSWFAIQQPEIHLHPRAQAALGDLVFQVAEEEQKCFLVETHSDFTIDRFRLNFKRSVGHKTTAQVLFFERTQGGNKVSVIPITDNGEYPREQPDSFRDFFLKEQMSLLEL